MQTLITQLQIILDWHFRNILSWSTIFIGAVRKNCCYLQPCLEFVVHYSVQVPYYNPVKFAPWLNVVGRAKKPLRGKLLIVCSWSAAKYLRHLFSSFRKFCQINQMKKWSNAMITQLVLFLALVFDLTVWSDSFRTFQVFPLEPRLIFSSSVPQACRNEA